MIRAILVVLLGLLGMTCFASGQAPQTTIYFAIRTDNQQGGGTKVNPYNGAPASFGYEAYSWFDKNMHKVTTENGGANLDIVLDEGVYETHGDHEGMGVSGYLLQENTTLRGAGMGKTILRLTGFDEIGVNHVHCVVTVGKYPHQQTGTPSHSKTRMVNYDNVTVRDLTVDCNAPNLFGGMLFDTNDPVDRRNNRFWHTIYGVWLSGSNCTIKNVEVINAFGTFFPSPGGTNPHPSWWEGWMGVGHESFALGISAMTGDAHSNLIENCVVRNSHGGYVSAIYLFGGSKNLAPEGQPPNYEYYYNSGTVRNNLVINGAYCAYSGGGTIDSAYLNNIAQNVHFGFRYDSGVLLNTVFSGNVFMTWQGGFVLKSSGGAHAQGITITHNTFAADGTHTGGETANGVIHIEHPENPIDGLTISNNTISAADGRDALALTGSYSNVSFTNNGTSLPVSPSLTSTINYVPFGTQGVIVQDSSPTFGFMTLKKPLDPGLRLQATGGGTNEKLLDFVYRGDLKQFMGRLLSDDGMSANSWFTLTRSGASATRFDLGVQDTYLWNVARIPDELRIDGGQMKIKEQTNGVMGVGTLVGGTLTVSNTTVTTGSRIFVTRQSINGSAGTGFLEGVPGNGQIAISSRQPNGNLDTTDVSKVAWLVINPAP